MMYRAFLKFLTVFYTVYRKTPIKMYRKKMAKLVLSLTDSKIKAEISAQKSPDEVKKLSNENGLNLYR